MDCNNSVSRAFDTIEQKVAELKMHKNSPINSLKTFIVVEGRDDTLFYGHFFDSSKVDFYISGSCYYVVEILKKLNSEQSFKDCLIGIKDADFDHIEKKVYNINNLFLTDVHDWENMCCTEQLENNIQAEYIISNKDLINTVRTDLFYLSILRLYNCKNNCSINFNGISMPILYTGNSKIDEDKCLTYIKNTCNNDSINAYPVKSDIDRLAKAHKYTDLRQLTQGHDLIDALSVKLRKIRGNDPLGKNGLSLLFRNSYNISHFKQTKLYQSLDNWMKKKNNKLWKIPSTI